MTNDDTNVCGVLSYIPGKIYTLNQYANRLLEEQTPECMQTKKDEKNTKTGRGSITKIIMKEMMRQLREAAVHFPLVPKGGRSTHSQLPF